MTLQPGDAAPDFTLPDQNGEPVTLTLMMPIAFIWLM